MSKDPAFLFYPGDWLGGTMTFSRSHKGAYMDLLMAQFNNGHMSIQDIKTILGPDFDTMWEQKLKSKFKKDDKGLFFNEKMEEEVLKRRKFTDSRKRNLNHKSAHTRSHMNAHMRSHMENENENENENININKDINDNRNILLQKREKKFRDSLIDFVKTYGQKMIDDFARYWTEPNKSKTKMRFELEKTWDTSRRLITWSSRDRNKGNKNNESTKYIVSLREIEDAADLFAQIHNKHPDWKDDYICDQMKEKIYWAHPEIVDELKKSLEIK